MEAVILAIVAIPFIFGLVALAVVWRAFVASQLWTWFAVPFFHVEPMGIAVAIGLSCIVSVFIHTPSHKDGKEKTSKESAWEFASIFLFPLLALFIGWVALKFV